jgi:putative ABC transport system permease protein
MRTLNRKLLRDLRTMRGQVVAIVAIIACGIAAYLTVVIAYRGLTRMRQEYYRDYRMADLFATVKRAPRSVVRDLESIPGVRRVSGRILFEVTVDLVDLPLPVTGRVISVPDRRRRILNDLHLTRGRWFEGDGDREVVVADRFAREHGLEVGDVLRVVMNNKKESLRIVATALSPEFVYLIRGGGEVLPDPRHFTVLWVSESFAEAIFDFEDACNDFVATLDREARLEDVIDGFDARLDRFGSIGAYGRKDQLSHRSLNDEIEGLRGTATMIPTIFLGVAAFTLNMLMRRLVQTQRTQLALLRAVGYGLASVVGHYLKFALLVGGAGALAGSLLGLWFARGMAEMYRAFFDFPRLVFHSEPSLLLVAFAVSLGFSALGALGAVHSAARLDPAEGMHPPSPRSYRRTWAEAIGWLWGRIGFTGRMILRNVARTKLRSAVTVTGVSLAASILLLGFYGPDTMDELMDRQFRMVERQDIRVTFHAEQGRKAIYELCRLDGVRMVEGEQGLGVRLRNGWRSRRTGIAGIERGQGLHALLDDDLRPVALPDEGILLSRKLADLLAVRPGDAIEVEVLTGRKQRFTVLVASVVEEYLGMFAYANLDTLSRWIGEERVVSGALLRVDPLRVEELGRRLKELPAVASVAVKARTLQSFRETIAASQGIMTSVLILFAGTICFGVIYNTARISLSERQRELGSLRVLGYTHAEVARLLMGENLLLTGCALPFGIGLGLLFCWFLTIFYDTDLYRFPFVVKPPTILKAIVVVAVFTLLANLAVRRKAARLDLVEVLKARE